jgi:hypothetical protein
MFCGVKASHGLHYTKLNELSPSSLHNYFILSCCNRRVFYNLTTYSSNYELFLTTKPFKRN